MASSSLIKGVSLIEAIAKAQGMDASHIRRIVVDVKFNDVARVYVELAGSRELLEVNWADTDIEVKVLDRDKSNLTLIDVSWPDTYICPQCGMPGLRSALDNDCCTNCANRRRGV